MAMDTADWHSPPPALRDLYPEKVQSRIEAGLGKLYWTGVPRSISNVYFMDGSARCVNWQHRHRLVHQLHALDQDRKLPYRNQAVSAVQEFQTLSPF